MRPHLWNNGCRHCKSGNRDDSWSYGGRACLLKIDGSMNFLRDSRDMAVQAPSDLFEGATLHQRMFNEDTFCKLCC